jgi:hypothetical protein
MVAGKTIRWVEFPPPDDIDPDEIVWVSVRKIERSWIKRPDEYVGPGGTGKAIAGRYKKVGAWIQLGNPLWMPWIVLADDGEISFTDGRHRFAWLRDHGVIALPIQVPSYCAEAVQTRFGTSARLSDWSAD